MNRRKYLDLVSTGIGAAVTGPLDSSLLDSEQQNTDTQQVPRPSDLLLREEVLRDGYERENDKTGINFGVLPAQWDVDDNPTLYYAERSFTLIGSEESAPAEVVSRVSRIDESETRLTPERRDQLFDSSLEARYDRTSPVDYEFSDWVESAEDTMQINDKRRKTIWARLPILYHRTDVPQPDPLPTHPYREFATAVQETAWGAFEITINVEYPAKHGQTRNTVNQLADWQHRLVDATEPPEPTMD